MSVDVYRRKPRHRVLRATLIAFATSGATVVQCVGVAQAHACGTGVGSSFVQSVGVSQAHLCATGVSTTTIYSVGVSQVHPCGVGGTITTVNSQGTAEVHPRGVGASFIRVSAEGTAQAHVRAVGTSITRVPAEGVSRAYPRALSISMSLVGSAAPTSAHPRAIGQSQTRVASVGTSRGYSRARYFGTPATAVSCVGAAQVHPRTITPGPIVLSFVTVPARVHPRAIEYVPPSTPAYSVGRLLAHPRAVGVAISRTIVSTAGIARGQLRATGLTSTTVASAGKLRSHLRTFGETETVVDSVSIACVHPRATGQGQLVSGLLACVGVSCVHPRDFGVNISTLYCQGISAVHPRDIVIDTIADCVGVALVHPRGRGVIAPLVAGTSRIHPRCVGHGTAFSSTWYPLDDPSAVVCVGSGDPDIAPTDCMAAIADTAVPVHDPAPAQIYVPPVIVPQYLRPDEDLANYFDRWLPEPLWQQVNEDTASDIDYITGEVPDDINPGAQCIVGLTVGYTPAAAGDHILRARVKVSSLTALDDCRIRIRRSDTLASLVLRDITDTITTSWQTYAWTLTADEILLLAGNYGRLAVGIEFQALSAPYPRYFDVSWIEFQIPSAV